MSRTSTTALALLGLAPLTLVPMAAHAQTTQASQKPVLTTLHNFMFYLDGNFPSALTLGPDGSLYGTCNEGGNVPDGAGSTVNGGSIFKIAPDGTYTELFQFDFKNGTQPSSTLAVGPDGALYGTTDQGGKSGSGTAFRITPQGVLKTLVNFTGASGSPAVPLALTAAADGSFYGTSAFGGTHGVGTVFHMTAAGVVTVVHSFAGPENNVSGSALTFGPDGALYGTTSADGASKKGTVYRLTTGGTFTVLHSFTGNDGVAEGKLVVGPDGDLYGAGGEPGGDIYKITPSGTFTILHRFSNDGHGLNPADLTLGADGNFYGATVTGGTVTSQAASGAGTVFVMTLAGQVTTLYKFHTAFDGFSPRGVTFAPDGTLYGTTAAGGTHAGFAYSGTIWKLILP